MRLPPSFRRALPILLLACASCSPPPPADPVVVQEWSTVTRAAVTGVEPRVQARIAALGALAMYESFAAEYPAAFRSLAGQVNGLWNVPVPENRRIDGAIAAALTQRFVLDSLLAGNAGARALVDSVATAQVNARRAAGIDDEMVKRSLGFAASLAHVVLRLAPQQSERTLVLRHPQECTFATRNTGVVLQATPVAAPAGMPAFAAVEARLIDALVAADSIAAAKEASCVRAMVRGRISTRP